VQNWYHHAGYFIEVFHELDVSTNNSSFESLRALLVSFLARVPDTEHPLEPKFTYTIELYETLAKDDGERNSQIEMELRATLIRQQTSRLYQNESMSFERTIDQLYEPKLTLKCHKSWCSYFTGGFNTTDEQHAHLARHERSFYCPKEGCFASSLGFVSESLLEKHRTAWHRMKSDQTQFPKRSRKTYGNLHAAVVSNDIDAVEFGLVSQSLTAKPNTKEFKESLLYTTRKGDTAMCRLLMSHAAIDTSSILFLEVFVAATIEGNLETVKLFGPQLGDGIGRDCGRHAFLRACEAGHLATAKFLYDACGCKNHMKPGVFSHCVLKNYMGMVKYLLEMGSQTSMAHISLWAKFFVATQ
jgi:flagellar biosynthesis regulator FlaF